MPTILRKSLTAWEQLPALPPTPRKNSRPPLFLAFASNSAMLVDDDDVQLIDDALGFVQVSPRKRHATIRIQVMVFRQPNPPDPS